MGKYGADCWHEIECTPRLKWALSVARSLLSCTSWHNCHFFCCIAYLGDCEYRTRTKTSGCWQRSGSFSPPITVMTEEKTQILPIMSNAQAEKSRQFPWQVSTKAEQKRCQRSIHQGNSYWCGDLNRAYNWQARMPSWTLILSDSSGGTRIHLSFQFEPSSRLPRNHVYNFSKLLFNHSTIWTQTNRDAFGSCQPRDLWVWQARVKA